MKNELTLQELAEAIKRQQDSRRDFIATTDRLWMDVYSDEGHRLTMEVNGGEEAFGINDVAHGQIAQKLGIPGKYYNRLRAEHPDLLSTNVNALFKREPSKRLVRTLDGNARAFLSERYGIVFDNALVLNSALPTLLDMPELTFRGLALTERRLYVQAVWPKLEAEVKVGEPVQAGVIISNSEVGCGSFSVEQLIFVLGCLNGQTYGHSIRRAHVSRRIEEDNIQSFYSRDTVQADIKAFTLKVRDVVKNAFDKEAFETEIKLLQECTERKIPKGKVESTIEEIVDRAGIYQQEKDDFLERVIEGGDLSQWGLAQAATSMANNTLDYDRVIELERIGGKICAMGNDVWAAVTSN